MTYADLSRNAALTQILFSRIAIAALVLQGNYATPWVYVSDSDSCPLHDDLELQKSPTNVYFHCSQWGITNLLEGDTFLELDAPPPLPGENLPEQLKELALGFSVRQLSEAVGVSHTRFYEWLNGEPLPTERIADFEGVVDLLREMRERSDYLAFLDRRVAGDKTIRDLVVSKKWSAVRGFLHQIEAFAVTPGSKVLRMNMSPSQLKADVAEIIDERDVDPDYESNYVPLDDDSTAIAWSTIKIG